MTNRNVLRGLMGGATLLLTSLGSVASLAPARAGQGAGGSVYLPLASRPVPPPGACKHLETVKAWQATVDVTWSDIEGPTVRMVDGYLETFNATAQQTLHMVTEAPLGDEEIYDSMTGAVVGRVFTHPYVNGGFQRGAVTGSTSFVAEETVYTPPDGAGGAARTARTHYASSGAFADTATAAGWTKITIFGNDCKFNLEIKGGAVNLTITINGDVYTSEPSSSGGLYLRQVGLSPDGVVTGRAMVIPGYGTLGSPFQPAPPSLTLMATRTNITAWRDGGPLRAAEVAWRLAPVTN